MKSVLIRSVLLFLALCVCTTVATAIDPCNPTADAQIGSGNPYSGTAPGIRYGSVAVQTTATAVGGTTAVGGILYGRRVISISNQGANIICCGGDALVTCSGAATDGFAIPATTGNHDFPVSLWVAPGQTTPLGQIFCAAKTAVQATPLTNWIELE